MALYKKIINLDNNTGFRNLMTPANEIRDHDMSTVHFCPGKLWTRMATEK